MSTPAAGADCGRLAIETRERVAMSGPAFAPRPPGDTTKPGLGRTDRRGIASALANG